MWRMRFKDTKEPFVVTSRIGYYPRTGLSSAEVARAVAVADVIAAERPIPRRGVTKRKSPAPRALEMPHGCRQKTTIAGRSETRQELKRQHGAYDAEDRVSRPFVPVLRRTCSMCGACGKYYLSYRDKERAVTALKISGALVDQGISFKALELVNQHGKTMAEMVTFGVEIGYALRHKNEKWYWASHTGRVWFRRAGDTEGAWRRDEKVLALQENRKKRRSAGQQKLIMVKGNADGTTEELPHYLL